MPSHNLISSPETRRSEARSAEIVVASLDVDCSWLNQTEVLSEDERRRAKRFAFARDRRRFVRARTLLRHLLGVRLEVPAQGVELVAGPQGKPELGPSFAHTGLQFNLSHAAGLATCAFAWNGRVGVDIELVKPIPDADEVAALVFSPAELAAYRALAPYERGRAFFNGWTRKEAFVKALGQGFSASLQDFDVSLTPGQPARILRVGRLSSDECGWSLRSFRPAVGFVGAVVLESSAAASRDSVPIWTLKPDACLEPSDAVTA